MADTSEWLPPLELFESYNGDWNKYVNALYEFFKRDFIEAQPKFDGQKIFLKRCPLINGKDATFWHIISEGDTESSRIPEIRRCERIRWPRPIIEHSGESNIKLWKNNRKGENRICIWLETREYLVVLAVRKDYILFWTSYPVTRNHQKDKLQKEYERFKANAAF
jgi:hypothetical protein